MYIDQEKEHAKCTYLAFNFIKSFTYLAFILMTGHISIQLHLCTMHGIKSGALKAMLLKSVGTKTISQEIIIFC